MWSVLRFAKIVTIFVLRSEDFVLRSEDLQKTSREKLPDVKIKLVDRKIKLVDRKIKLVDVKKERARIPDLAPQQLVSCLIIRRCPWRRVL